MTPAWPDPHCPRGQEQHPLTGSRTQGALARTRVAVYLGRGRHVPGVGLTTPGVTPVLLWLGSDLHS